MAAPTLDKNDTDSELNPGQTDYDQKFNSIAHDETDREFNSMVSDPASGLGDVEKAAANGGVDQSQSLSDQEDSNTGFNNSFTGKNNRNPTKSKVNWRKGGPIGAIIGILGIGGFGLATLFSPSLLLVHIQESLVNKYDSQNTSFTIRTNKIISKKLTSDATSGSCQLVKVACRFNRPSNRLLSNMEKNGITAINSKGDPITKTRTGFPNERPSSYKFIDSAGTTHTVDAKNFYKELSNNAEFRSAFHKAFNTRFMTFTDAIFTKIAGKFGFTKKSPLSSSEKPEDVAKDINEKVQVPDEGVKAAAEEGGAAADNAVKEVVGDGIKEEADKLAKSGRGDAVMLAGGLVCMVSDVPGTIIRIERAYQIPQLIRFSMIFLTTASAIKAGDATPEQVAALGTLLTTVVKDKSAMDSFGMKYSLYGDTAAKDNTSYQKFIPGGDAISALGGVVRYTNSNIKKGTCSAIGNPVTGVVVDAALSTTIVGGIINAAVGFGISEAVTVLAPPLIDGIMGIIQSSGLQEKILAGFFGDLTQNLTGENVGDALASGSAHMMGQTANAGYNMPLTIDQAVAYDQTTKQVQLAYAEEDRATLSPLDPMSSNTFLGSFIDKLLPFTTQISSFSSILSSIGSLITSSPFNLFTSTASAADLAAQYTGCPDPAITDNNLAAGPFCNIQYGVPVQYLDRDPDEVLNSVLGDIDPNTGNPLSGSDLQKWVDMCSDGATDQANNCVINDQTANYALYMMDHRIQVDMDGEDNTES